MDNPMQVPLEHLLEQRYSDPSQWVTIRELRAGVGFAKRGSDRRIDLAAFCCWPSKGLYRVAYEVKRTRGDFMREIGQPEKRRWVEENFHQTYFVTVPGVCKLEEVPESWGLLVSTKKMDKLICKKIAQHRELDPFPEMVALSTIRALAAQNRELRRRHYFYEGLWIRQEHLDSMVKEDIDIQLGPAQKELELAKSRAQKAKAEYEDKLSTLEEPLLELAREVNAHSYYRRSSFTKQNVRDWIQQVKRQAIKPLLSSLEHCSNSLNFALGEARKEGLEGLAVVPKKRNKVVDER